MSNHLISLAYKRDLKTAMRKSVMVLLADKASDDGSGIYASKQTMADELCCSRQAVIDTIKAFIHEGILVEIGQRRNANGFTVEYGIQIDALEAVPLVKCHAERLAKSSADPSTTLTRQPAGPVNDVDPTRQPAGPHPSTTLTQTLLEPSMNHISSEAKASSDKRARPKRDDFPRPDWAEPQVWDDFLQNRKRKRLPNTATAYAGFLKDIERIASDEWPPGKLLEYAAAKGWGGIYEPQSRDNRNGSGAQNHRSDGSGVGKTAAAAAALYDKLAGAGCGEMGGRVGTPTLAGGTGRTRALPHLDRPQRYEPR